MRRRQGLAAWVVTFLGLAVTSGIIGWGGYAANETSSHIAKVLMVVFCVLVVVAAGLDPDR